MIAWMEYGGGQARYDELVQKKLKLNLVGFFAMPMPTQPLGWFQKPIKSADDMKGLKFRTVGLATDVMQAMGVAVTQLPGGEIVPALERGVIEAFERSEEHTSELQSLMRISYAVFCLKKKKIIILARNNIQHIIITKQNMLTYDIY